MKFLIDNNPSYKPVNPLRDFFPDTAHVRTALSVTADDFSIWDYAKKNDYTLLTKDNDFDERSQVMGCPPKLVQLICGNKPALYLLNLILLRKETILAFC